MRSKASHTSREALLISLKRNKHVYLLFYFFTLLVFVKRALFYALVLRSCYLFFWDTTLTEKYNQSPLIIYKSVRKKHYYPMRSKASHTSLKSLILKEALCVIFSFV